MCTGFIICGDRSATNFPILAKNRDKEKGEIRGPEVMLREKDGYEFWGMTHEERKDIITIGMNEHGLAIGTFFVKINKPGWEEDWVHKPGADAPIRKCGTLAKEILTRCDSVRDALHFLHWYVLDKEHFIGGNLLVADKHEGLVLENTDRDMCFSVLNKGITIRTNYFVRLNPYGPDIYNYPSAYMRYKRVEDLLAAKDKLDVEYLKNVMRDHQDGPSEYSVCRHIIPDDPFSHATMSSFLCLTNTETGGPKLLVAEGTPCNNQFKEYTFKR